ncbi:MAG: thiamine phosphate synthase [Firmicutes bacterium HGW-Firmicutes-13]|nr:MAG: thiamine phosphate synthase [Firmicutes bacterium HGW-Firmicutes-13]
MNLDVYVVTNRQLAGVRPLGTIVEESLAGGASVIQLREKDISTRDFVELAAQLKKIVRKYNSLFIINDRIDVAQAVGADGVHLGQDDMPAVTARDILGKEAVIGVSVSTLEEAEKAVRDGADYLGVSAIFSTPTKSDAVVVGLSGLRKIADAVQIPLAAIGGINAGNAADIIRAGADGVAVVSEIMKADNPRLATARLLEKIKAAKLTVKK